MSNFDDLMERVKSLTGLEGRDAAHVAFAFDPDEEPRPQDIIEKAIELGFDVERKHDEQPADEPAPFGVGITMDPAQVLTEVFMVMPRCVPVREDDQGNPLPVEIPHIGRAPEEIRNFEGHEQFMEELPEDARLILAKIDVFEGKVTFWVRDGANEIDRPIGPVDLTQYTSERQMNEAFMDLLKRLPRVLAADSN
jgi:hypothetical protein